VKSANADQWAPQFGPQGFIYPVVWRVLGWNRFFSPSMWLPRGSATAIDVYLLIWWVVEVVLVLLVWYAAAWESWASWLACGLFAFRLVDMLFVQVSILIKGFYRRPTDWFSSARIVLLTLFNAVELMFIYGVLYWALSQLQPRLAAFQPALSGLYDGIYLSVVTATTLGYGTPHPTAWLSRLISMFESGHLLLVILALIAYARSSGLRMPDREAEERGSQIPKRKRSTKKMQAKAKSRS
jgi:hypothetical protein